MWFGEQKRSVRSVVRSLRAWNWNLSAKQTVEGASSPHATEIAVVIKQLVKRTFQRALTSCSQRQPLLLHFASVQTSRCSSCFYTLRRFLRPLSQNIFAVWYLNPTCLKFMDVQTDKIQSKESEFADFKSVRTHRHSLCGSIFFVVLCEASLQRKCLNLYFNK